MSAPGRVREHLIQALESDLVGPFDPQGDPEEILRLPPSRWYLVGYLAPETGREIDDPNDDVMESGGDQTEVEAPPADGVTKRRNRHPASLGLSVLLPAASQDAAAGDDTADDDTVNVKVLFAEYRAESREVESAGDGGGKARTRTMWRRQPRDPVHVDLRLDPAELERGIELPGFEGVRLVGKLAVNDEQGTAAGLLGEERGGDSGTEPGTRVLALFLVNHREPGPKGRQDERFLFQVSLELEYEGGILARPNRRDEASEVWDDRIADLQYRHRSEYAVGHGTAVEVSQDTSAGPVTRVRTTWLPRAEVRRVVTRADPAVVTAMDQLADLEDGAAAGRALRPLVAAYQTWIEEQAKAEVDSDSRRETLKALVKNAHLGSQRILEGIELLEHDDEALEAFRVANRAMATVRHRKGDKKPSWRLFQLAFVLLNLPSVTDKKHQHRDYVELIFFPTGGGKTEAYLGVIGFLLVLRRLRGRQRPDGGLGVAVILRYTLRLLTLDQLGRAASLICALEMLRRQRDDLGEIRFSVGLWVGRAATANTLVEAVQKIRDARTKGHPSPFPLTDCPWCGKKLDPGNFKPRPNGTKPTEIAIGCHYSCDFALAKNREGLPVLFVDDQIYRELPSFLVATVDKFAMLPWRGETGMLFGRATARRGREFWGPMQGETPAAGPPAVDLPAGLAPPELIVQDELHLISGPLGTMVGLYETTLDMLCRDRDGNSRPKIIASTATVRRAQDQVRALFARQQVKLFPPPVIDESETFFARVDHRSPGRLYVGVAAPGKPMKALLIRTYVTLLAAAAKQYDPSGPVDQEADAYMTLAGYFNSLRELSGMRRLVEDEVRSRTAESSQKKPESHGGPHPWFENRPIQAEPVELTSRESTARVTRAKARLDEPYRDKEHVDVLLASNMISVGVDIDRLGLMVVAGQPKATSEYIQASSRVGRREHWPGLVVTCFNHYKPRDRSHYERFTAYHESFYRFVEAASLTPFSAPALDRGMAANLVAMTRLADPEMTPSGAAMQVKERRQLAEAAVEALASRGVEMIPKGIANRTEMEEKRRGDLQQRGRDLIDAWERLVDAAGEHAGERCYSPYDRESGGNPMLYTLGGNEDDAPAPGSPAAKFAAPTSMRDVEPTVHLWLERRFSGVK